MTNQQRPNADIAVLVACGGNATRMGGINKILHTLGGKPVLWYSLQCFCVCPSVAEIVVICRPDDAPLFRRYISGFELPLPVRMADGGATRQESVQNGFRACDPELPYVAIHDGARPLISSADAERVFGDARKYGAATLGVPVKDTIKITENDIITATPERAKLRAVQTPQVFRRTLYADALALAAEQGRDYTDDCQLMEAAGHPVYITGGSYTNIKLTTPEDFAVAKAFLQMLQKEGNCNG